MALAPDQEGQLLRKLLLARGGSQPVLDSVNFFYKQKLEEILSTYRVETVNGDIAVFSSPFLVRPDINDLKGNRRPRSLLPYEARRSRLSYMAKLWAKLNLYRKEDGRLVESIDVFLGKIPVMVGSELCHTFGKSQEERYKMGEPEKDPQAYFIIKGAEKVLLNIEKLRVGVPYLYEDKDKYMVRYTSQTLTDTTVNIVFEDKYDVHVTFTKIGISDRSINIFYIFYALGLARASIIDEVYQIMDSFIVDKDPERQARRRREMRYFMQTTANTFHTRTQFDPAQIMNVIADTYRDSAILTSFDRNRELIKSVRSELFKNIPLPSDPNSPAYVSALFAKIRLLAAMIVKYVDFKNGYRSVDDRDAWGHKQLADAGKHMTTRFIQIWKSMVTTLQTKAKSNSYKTVNQLKNGISQNYMAEQFISSFTKELWGNSRGQREVSFVDTLKRDNLVAAHSHIRRINTPTNRRAQIREKRLLHNTQWGLICPVFTPEGESCHRIDTLVLLSDGSEVQIGSLKNGDEVLTINPITLQQEASKITSHFIKPSAEYGKSVFKITSFNGREIICTEDHPFLTQVGWVYARDLNPSAHLLTIFPGVKPLSHIPPLDEIILDEQSFKARLAKIGVKESLIEKHANDLNGKNIFPLRSTDPRVPILARICGFLLADGSLGLTPEASPWSSFCFGTENDAELFFQDMERLKFARHKLTYRESTIIDKETGREATHHAWITAYSACFASLLLALGLTYGKRVEKPSNPVPEWILAGSLLTKREFVAGFQGGDGSKIMWNKRHDKVKAGKFNLSRTMQHKNPKYTDSLMVFMEQLAEIMRELGVDVLRVWKQPESELRDIVRIDISDAEENLIKYMDMIGYRYATTKNTESLQLTEYLRYKHGMIQERIKLKEIIQNMTNQGMSPTPIAKKLGLRLRQVTSILEYQGNGGTLAPKGTVGVEEWLKTTHAVNNCVFMPIKSITPEAPCMVADFTTVSDNHSMISAGFVTHNCGLVKDSAVTVYVSLDRGDSIVRSRISGQYTSSPQGVQKNPIYLNGVPIGYCNSEELHKELLRLRRTQQLYFDTGIVLDQAGDLWIFTNDGRLCRPLMIVDPDTQQLMIDVLGLRDADLGTLLSQGVIEYVDAAEQEQPYIYIAETVRHLQARRDQIQGVIARSNQIEQDPNSTEVERTNAAKDRTQAVQRRKYTHCEIDPTAILGISAISMPFGEFNPGPRDTYQASMVRQALGPNSSRIELRYDTTMRTTLAPEVPTVSTDAHEWLGLDEYPQGQEVILAITTYGGQNQEDAIVFNKDAIDLGMFTMLIYHSYTGTICQSKARKERLQIPDYPQSQAHHYSKLDPTTKMVRVGETVSTGDCLVGKVLVDNVTGEVKNDSLYVEVGKQGVIDEVYVTENAESCKLIRIRIRELRKLQPGDKLASRYSQKGTIGAILPGDQMPWVQSSHPELNGVKPHLIFNPHGIPSRMTMGKIFEILLSKYSGIVGERQNATAFRRFSVEGIQDELQRLGFSRSGKEKLVNGITGREMDVDIYVGPAYYQLLRHLVQDKMQARGTGSVQFLTRQPTAGIRKRGGLRLGQWPMWTIKCLQVSVAGGNTSKFRETPKTNRPKRIQQCVRGLGENSRVQVESVRYMDNPEPSRPLGGRCNA